MTATSSSTPTAPVVLIVEDNVDLARAMAKILELEGVPTRLAHSGKAAIDQLADGVPALMLVDYDLTDTRADQLVERLAGAGRLIPFVVATGHGNETIAVEMMKHGARDYLVKGGAFFQLLTTVVTRVLGEVETENRLARAELALRESEARYRNLVEYAPDAICVAQAGRLVLVNAASLKLFAASRPEQLLGRAIIDLIHPDSRRSFRARMHELHETGRPVPLVEEKVVRLDGRVVDVEAAATPCLHEQQPAAQLIMRNIAERKAAQAQTREQQAKLAHVMRVNTMGEMVSQLAHEINQPLYAIANYAAACRETLDANRAALPADVVGWIDQIADQANRAGEIIRHVSGFVRKDPPQRQPQALGDLLHDVSRLLELDARARACQIQVIVPVPPPPLLIDRAQIEQVVVNLVLNAIEAMEQTSEANRQVAISCTTGDAEVEVAVRDRGAGFQGTDFEQLFEPYFSTKPQGMGMGLAISQSIIDAHGGRLWATANPDRGLTFHFTLPLPCGDSPAP